jgi:hypothetical protein
LDETNLILEMRNHFPVLLGELDSEKFLQKRRSQIDEKRIQDHISDVDTGRNAEEDLLVDCINIEQDIAGKVHERNGDVDQTVLEAEQQLGRAQTKNIDRAHDPICTQKSTETSSPGKSFGGKSGAFGLVRFSVRVQDSREADEHLMNEIAVAVREGLARVLPDCREEAEVQRNRIDIGFVPISLMTGLRTKKQKIGMLVYLERRPTDFTSVGDTVIH